MAGVASSRQQQSDSVELLERFGLTSFRPGQQEVIEAVFSGRDCLCVMPTGGGKSLCYQLPALAGEGTTLVISPLIALMKDQVDALDKLDIPATFINSSLAPADQYDRLQMMAAGGYDLVYIAPERLRSPRFLEAVRSANVRLLAVDEAHCVSEWGHDFRPDYARLGNFRRRLGDPQTIALTATATPVVRQDVIELLRLSEPQTFITGFARPNLHFEVATPPSAAVKDEELLEFLGETPGAGIIYAATRKRCGELVETLRSRLKRRVDFYHAGLTPEERRRVQEEFMSGGVDIIVATNAFGMGIDKAELRFVVHYNMPGSLEAYYQEAGRAGRDGKASRCLLLYSAQDRYIQEFFIENSYPSRDTVRRVYEYLRSLNEDPIEITQQDLKERLELSVGSEGVGACEHLLEKCGALERLDSQQNMASVRIDSDLPTLIDLLPKDAKVRRRVLRGIEQLVGDLRGERVYFQPVRLAGQLGIERDSLIRALRALNQLDQFDYVPPFRGRAVHLTQRDKPFEQLQIDFEELQRRKEAEYEKLNRVIRYARTRRCRQLEILDYFGDPSRKKCESCDNCPTGQSNSNQSNQLNESLDAGLLQAVQIALSGVARTHGRFGKQVVAQMLWGSKSARLAKWRLDKLSTYGLLNRLKLDDVVQLLDALIQAGLIEQVEVDRYRPVVQLSEAGAEVMSGQQQPLGLSIPEHLAVLLRSGPASTSNERSTTSQSPDDDTPPDPSDLPLLVALRQWRNAAADAAGIPPYRIFSNDTLAHLARRRPQTPEQLLEVKGIGPAKLERYGAALLEQIRQQGGNEAEDFSRQTGSTASPSTNLATDAPTDDVDPNVLLAEAAEAEDLETSSSRRDDNAEINPPHMTTPVPMETPQEDSTGEHRPDYYWTWRLLSSGFTLHECVRIRRNDTEQIIDHALQAAENGLAIDPQAVFSPRQIVDLHKVLASGRPRRIEPLLAQLPDAMGYQHVQLYLKLTEMERHEARSGE